MKSVFTSDYEGLLQSLIAARKAAKLTQDKLAARLGKSQSFVSKYERRAFQAMRIQVESR